MRIRWEYRCLILTYLDSISDMVRHFFLTYSEYCRVETFCNQFRYPNRRAIWDYNSCEVLYYLLLEHKLFHWGVCDTLGSSQYGHTHTNKFRSVCGGNLRKVTWKFQNMNMKAYVHQYIGNPTNILGSATPWDGTKIGGGTENPEILSKNPLVFKWYFIVSKFFNASFVSSWLLSSDCTFFIQQAHFSKFFRMPKWRERSVGGYIFEPSSCDKRHENEMANSCRTYQICRRRRILNLQNVVGRLGIS